MSTSTDICRVPGCGGPASGVCINQLPFDECPDVIRQTEEISKDSATPTPAGSTYTLIDTGGAASLDAARCDALLRSRGGIVIGIVAGPETGKTTMIATTYELIHRGKMRSFQFAGSETLRGYEERCYLARISCNAAAPDTPRTRLTTPLNFTHLRVATQAGIKDLYFSDRSGEYIDNALNRPTDFLEFVELARADVILLMIDVARLANDQAAVVSYARRLFMAMNQHIPLIDKAVWIVGTKADLIKSDEILSSVTEQVSKLALEFRDRSNGSVDVQYAIVSSRKRKGSAEAGEGLESLLTEITNEQSTNVFSSGVASPAQWTELDALMHPFRAFRI